MNTKKVSLPIEVPKADFCRNKVGKCQYLKIEGGHPICKLGHAPYLRYAEIHNTWSPPVIHKPYECSKLALI